MSKSSGGTRNYKGTATIKKRRTEYQLLMDSGNYSSGYISSSGGFYVIHNDHREIKHSGKDYSDVAARKLADKGYKVYLDPEKSIRLKQKTNDGRVYTTPVDFKTISTTGKYTIKNALDKASKQGVDTVVLYQRTNKMTREYVESQIGLYRDKSLPIGNEKSNIKTVIVVGLSGNVHRHKI